MRKQKFGKRVLAILFSVVMVLGTIPLPQFTMEVNATTQTVTKTVTWKMDGGASGTTTMSSDSLELFTTYEGANQTLRYTSTDPTTPIIFLSNSNKKVTFWTNTTRYVEANCEIVFPDIVGTVKSVEFNNAQFYGDGNQKMVVGIEKSTPYNDNKLLHLSGTTSDYDYESMYGDDLYNNITFVGDLEVTNNAPLKIMFAGDDTWDSKLVFKNGSIAITYETEEEVVEDSGHTFSFAVNGDKLIATCNNEDNNHNCELADRKAVLNLIADDATYNYIHHRATLNLADFITQTGLQVNSGGFTYKDRNTNRVLNDAPIDVGNYSVTCTITIDGNEYELAKNFEISESAFYSITNNYTQLNLSETSAQYARVIYITVVDPGVMLTSISVKGTHTNLTTENYGIHYNDENKKYSFSMPDEDVEIQATFEQYNFNISKDNSISNGTIHITNGTIENAVTAHSGDTITLTATSDEGYVLDTMMAKKTGNAYITVSVSGTGNTRTFTMPAYDVTVTGTWKKLLTNSDILVEEIPEQNYTGSAIEPTVVVKDGEIDITSQCTISYSDNTNAGEATVTVTARTDSAEYAGSTTKRFNIVASSTPVFSGHSLLLTGQIGVEFLITLPEGMNAQGCYMTFSGNQIDGNYRAAGQAIGNNRYQYIVYIPAYQMADKITPTFHYFENEVETTIVGEAYSAEDYIKWGLTNLTDERELNVIRALADYGYYSQIYLSGFNNWTIGTDYAAMDMNIGYSTSFDYADVHDALASYAVNSDIADLSYRLNFGSTTRLDIRFTADGGETVELDGVVKTPDTDGNYSLVSISGIPASQLTTGHTLQVGGKTATISPMSYAYTLLGRTNESNELKNLLCAFYNYGNACAAYNQN